MLKTTRDIGSPGWRLLVGPVVALHESSHALGCFLTRTAIGEFKPINVEVTDDGIVLGYVRHRQPSSPLKAAVISRAPVVVSLILLVFFALGTIYLVPSTPGIGGEALKLLSDLITFKSDPILYTEPFYPVVRIFQFVHLFLYTIAGLTVLNPLLWIVAFLAMTIMFSNAPSDVDLRNASTGIKIVLLFDIVWRNNSLYLTFKLLKLEAFCFLRLIKRHESFQRICSLTFLYNDIKPLVFHHCHGTIFYVYQFQYYIIATGIPSINRFIDYRRQFSIHS